LRVTAQDKLNADLFGFVLVFAPVRLALSSGQRPATDDPGRTQYAAFERYGTASRVILWEAVLFFGARSECCGCGPGPKLPGDRRWKRRGRAPPSGSEAVRRLYPL